MAKPKRVPWRLGIAWLPQRFELDERLVRAVEHQEHAAQVETRQPEGRLRITRATVFCLGGLIFAPTLQNLPQVVASLRVQLVDGDRPAGRLRGEVPFLLHSQHYTVVVVGVGEIETQRNARMIVLLGFRPVAHATVQVIRFACA